MSIHSTGASRDPAAGGGLLGKRKTYDIPDAAARLGISRSAAYEAARLGQIPTIRIGKRLLVPKAALDRLLGISGEVA